jgi:hypothetical protein
VVGLIVGKFKRQLRRLFIARMQSIKFGPEAPFGAAQSGFSVQLVGRNYEFSSAKAVHLFGIAAGRAIRLRCDNDLRHLSLEAI